MGSQMASDILQLLSGGQRSLTDITEQLKIPMTTAKYHVGNLLDAGLISVAETKYSIKGREVKLYSLTNQLLIVAPRQSNVRSLLLKYASLFGIVAFGSVIIAIISPLVISGSAIHSNMNAVTSMAMEESGSSYAKAVADGFAANITRTPDLIAAGSNGAAQVASLNFSPVPDAANTLAQVPPVTGSPVFFLVPDAALTFFLGGAMVIIVLLFYEIYLWKRH